MDICSRCDGITLIDVWMDDSHVWMKCEECGKLNTFRRQLDRRGSVHRNGKKLETNECCGEIE